MQTTIEKIAWIITWGRVVRKNIQTGEDPLPTLEKVMAMAEELYCEEHKRYLTNAMHSDGEGSGVMKECGAVLVDGLCPYDLGV